MGTLFLHVTFMYVAIQKNGKQIELLKYLLKERQGEIRWYCSYKRYFKIDQH